MSILQRNKKLAAGIGIAAAAAAVIALGAGTYAAFTDTENVQANTFAAGSINLVVGGQVTLEPFTYSNLKPGDVVSQTITVDNTGTIDGNLVFTLTKSGAENSCDEPETDAESSCTPASELQSQAEVSVDGQSLAAAQTTINAGLLAATPGPVTHTVTITVPTTAGNEIMTDSVTITASAVLTQV